MTCVAPEPSVAIAPRACLPFAPWVRAFLLALGIVLK